MKWVSVALLLGVFLFIWFCYSEESFNIVVINSDEATVKSVKIEFDEFFFTFGYLSGKTGQKTYAGWSGSWPRELIVEWVPASASQAETRRIVIGPSLVAGSDETLELVVHFKDSGVVVYPRIRQDGGASFRYRH